MAGRKRGRRVLVMIVLFVFLLNYLAFFTPSAIKPARAANPTIEQQISIINDISNTISSNSYGPTDNSLGLILWDSTLFTGATVYFEASIFCESACTGPTKTVYAALFNSSGSQVTGSEVTTTSTSTARVRSAAITANLTDNTAYTVQVKVDSGGTGRIRGGRLVVVQTSTTAILKTLNIVSVGKNVAVSATSDTQLTQKKIYRYNSAGFNPAPTIYFEATMNAGASGTITASLYTDGGTCTSQVTSSAVTVSTTRVTRVRSSAITLVNGTEYMVCVIRTTADGNIRNAQIILEQSSATGITALETLSMISPDLETTTSASYANTSVTNGYTPANWAAGTFAYLYYATMKSSAGNAFAILENRTAVDNIDTPTTTELSTASTSYVLLRSADVSGNSDWPSSAVNLLNNIKNDGGGTTSVSGTWLVIQVSSLQTPEYLVWFFPLALFLPVLIKWFKLRQMKKGFIWKNKSVYAL